MGSREKPGTGRPFSVEPRLEYVRPGPNALTWLESTVRDLKAGDPFRPVTVLVPNNYAGRLARWHLGRRQGYVNVSTTRLRQAISLVAGPPRSGRYGMIHPVVEASAVRAALRRTDAFGSLRHQGLERSLIDLFRELRRVEVDPDEVSRLSRTPTTRAALAVYRAFRWFSRRYDDPSSIAAAASRRLSEVDACPRDLTSLGALVLFLPIRLDPAEARFLAEAARWIPLVAAFVEVGDAADVAAEGYQADAGCLGRALGMAPPSPEPSPRWFPPGTTGRVIRAPDPSEEVREVIRCVVADLESGVPLPRVGILYRQDDPYVAITRDALDAAGIPWVSSEGRRVGGTNPGRALLGLLRLPEREFSRAAVLEWLETLPDGSNPISEVPPASWDRLSRVANVSRGAAQWIRQLRRHADNLETDLARLDRDEFSPAARGARLRQVGDARRIADTIEAIEGALRPPEDGSSWAAFVAWGQRLRLGYLGQSDVWPEGERTALASLDDILSSLALADRVQSGLGTDLDSFLAALEWGLDSRRVPTGRLGDGILIEPVAAVAGLTFDRVYILGMREGAFPTPPPSDPFFPVGGSDPLGRKSRSRMKERRDFLVALATADGGTVTLCTSDSDGRRASIPSRWLLALAGELAERRLDATSFRELVQADQPWLRVVLSTEHGVTRDVAPADLEDRRLGEVARWRRDQIPLARHPIARRADLPLERALIVAASRRGEALTAFDGNVSDVASTSRRLASLAAGHRPISATAIQSWATCGFQYFLSRVLGVEPTELPDDVWTIEPMERGSLIHRVLEDFFVRLAADGRPKANERYGPSDVALVETLAIAQFGVYETNGVTGHPLAWENARRAILADLRAFLAFDSQWRVERQSIPSYFEQRFGFEDDLSWPALPVDLGDATLRFRGVIDRVDLDRANGSGFVFDYKTGSPAPYGTLADDPIAAGKHIQLALYSQVVRARMPEIGRVAGAFWFITTRGEFKRVEMTASPEIVEKRLVQALGIVARGIRSGAFPQVPGGVDRASFVNCRFCDFDRVCPPRRDIAWDRKKKDRIAAIAGELTLSAAQEIGE